MTTRIPNLCASCLLFTEDSKCVAFPDGIPAGIRLYGADHRKPISGDDGLVWQFDPDKPEQYAEWLSANTR